MEEASLGAYGGDRQLFRGLKRSDGEVPSPSQHINNKVSTPQGLWRSGVERW